jgi:hypothetical protein
MPPAATVSAAQKLAVGAEVIYCHEGEHRRAQVSEVDPVTCAVRGIAVLTTLDDKHWHIDFGVINPKPATKLEHRIVDGYFWKR